MGSGARGGWGPGGAGPTWAYRLCKSRALQSESSWWWRSRVAGVVLALDLTAMAGPQEFLSGKLRLCFTPAARTSLLLLRLNDAAMRALQECQRQQVRPPGPPLPRP